MSTIQWITPGSLANLLIGIESSVLLQAIDSKNPGDVIEYNLINGTLPAGLSLSNDGIISGTPTYSNPNNNYFTTVDYNFIVRAKNSLGVVADKNFTIIISNTVNQDFIWITPAGDLGTIPNGEYYSLQLQAQSTQNLGITYGFISGELPPGMQLLSTGYLKGVPTFLNPTAVDQSQAFRFTIRATNSVGHINDRSFTLNVTNVYGPIIRPTTTELGSYFDGTFFSQQLTVQELNPVVEIKWSVKEGQLPPGITLSSAGLLSGYVEPLQLIGQYGPQGYDGDSNNTIGSTCILSNCTITGSTLNIGSVDSGIVLNGMYLSGAGLAPNTQVVGAITEWERGKTYSINDVVIYNNNYYIANKVVLANSDFNLADWDSTSTIQNKWRVSPSQSVYNPTNITGTVLDEMREQQFDLGPYDFNQVTQSGAYSFTIQAYDGANYDTQRYIIEVVSRPGFTADSSNLINNTYLPVDSGNVYLPIIRNTVSTLPTGRQNSYYAFKFDGYDFNNDSIVYSITSTAGTFDAEPFDPLWIGDGTRDPATDYNNGELGSFDHVSSSTGNLPGLQLDAQSGWIYGQIGPQTSAIKEYSFGITVSKTVNGIVYSGRSNRFKLPVLGDVNNTIEWITSSDLGTIDNGSVSELRIVAKSRLGKSLIYTLYDVPGVSAKLPQGLSLLESGEISGRVSFESFTVDTYNTTFDNDFTTVDRVSTFTVKASDNINPVLETVSAYQEFTLTLKIIDKNPYVNLYLKALPAFDQRQIYRSIIANAEIFDPDLIYRPTDPWFGVNHEIDMLFLPGLNTETLDNLELAIARNHWTKKYNFGDIKTAVVLDATYTKKYEVVYIEVLDPAENANIDATLSRRGPAIELDLTNVIDNPYIDKAGNEYKIIYPNSSENMIKQLEENVGYADQSSLPPWMTSNQLATNGSTNTFNPPIGFVKAVVLAYTKPGASKLIAYRLKTAGINFQNIEFSVDRYEVDNYYSANFNPVTNKYNTGVETTFDVLPKNNIGLIVSKVNYAVEVPFNQINGRSVDYINANGGIDGREVTPSINGDTLVFAKQEDFLSAGPYDGWVNYFDAYIGDNITTSEIEGYDSESFDTLTVVPGFLEKLQGTSPTNQRGSVWKININNGIVFLTPVLEVQPYDRVQITDGRTYKSAVLYYTKPNKPGQTVPYYTIYLVSKDAIQTPTTFNDGTTKFFSKRDHYYVPNSQDKYLKFPQYGVFN